MEGASGTGAASSAGSGAGPGAGPAISQAGGAPAVADVAESKTAAPQLAEVPKADDLTPKEQKQMHAFLMRMQGLTGKEYKAADDALDDAEEHFSQNEKTIKNYKDDDEMVWTVVKNDPRVAKLIYDMYQGAPFPVAAALHYDQKEFVPPEGSEYREAWAKNVEERTKKQKEMEELTASIDQNLPATDKEFADFIAEKQLDEKGTTQLRSFINELLENAYRGKISRSVFEMGHHYLTRDQQLQEARETGEISARNQKIEVEKEKLKSTGDGMPHLDSAVTEVMEEPKPKEPANPFVTAIDTFNQRKKGFPG